MKRALKFGLQALVSAALLYWLLHAIDLHGLAARFAGADAATLALALALSLSVSLLHAARWRCVMRASGETLGFARTLRIVLIGYFFNQMLPSSVGGDVMRMYFGNRAGLGLGAAVNSVIVDHLITLAALLLAVAATLPWVAPLIPDPLARWSLMALVPCGFAGFAVLLFLDRLPARLQRWRPARALASFAGFARRFVSSPRLALPAVGYSVAAFVCFGLIVHLAFRSFGVEVAPLYCTALLLPVMLVTILPVSVAGWGVREGAMVVAFGFAGVAPDAAFAMSVLFGLILLLTGVPGSVLWWSSGARTHAARP